MLACDGFSGFLKVYRVCCWSSWISEGKGGPGLSLAVIRDLREVRVPAGPDELAAFETDVLAGFVLARAAAGLSDRLQAGRASWEQVSGQDIERWMA